MDRCNTCHDHTCVGCLYVNDQRELYGEETMPAKKTYFVSVDTMASVEADNEEEAMQLAKEKFKTF